MLEQVLAAVVPVLLAAGIGYVWVRLGRPLENSTLTPLVVDVGTPCLILATFLKASISPVSFAAVGLATITALMLFAIIGVLVLRLFSFRIRTFIPSLTFPNNGNLGLPLAAYAFGHEGLGYAIVFYAICMIGQFTAGQAIAAGAANWRGMLRLPLIYATGLGVLVSVFKIGLPVWFVSTITLIGGMTIPLMLLMLGASLARLRVKAVGKSVLLSLIRIVIGAGVGFAVAIAFKLHGAAASVVVMQCAMPVAVYNYLFAQKWNNEPEEVAGLVVASTLISVFSVPALLYFLTA
jgi:malate permease and related proteins